MTALEQLVRSLTRLPGIGARSASRIAYHLIKADAQANRELGRQIATIQDMIHNCSICGSYTEQDPCPVCTDPTRDRNQMCVVEQPQDVLTLEASGAYRGLYHVLHGALSPLDGIGPEQLSIGGLIRRIREGGFEEIIIATNPTEEGDTTALYLHHVLKSADIRVTRLASGLPVGGDLEYADRVTLARSLRGRVRID